MHDQYNHGYFWKAVGGMPPHTSLFYNFHPKLNIMFCILRRGSIQCSLTACLFGRIYTATTWLLDNHNSIANRLQPVCLFNHDDSRNEDCDVYRIHHKSGIGLHMEACLLVSECMNMRRTQYRQSMKFIRTLHSMLKVLLSTSNSKHLNHGTYVDGIGQQKG
jgi:hypothetical protein